VQREQIKLICKLNGWELVEVYMDAAVSGGVPFRDRPEGRRLFDAVERGTVIVASKLDRYSRDTADALTTTAVLIERGVDLYLHDVGGLVTSGPLGKLMMTLLAACATFERSRIGERIADAKRLQKREGRYLGGKVAPFGYRKVDRREPGADNPKWYLEPVAEIHAAAKQMKVEGLSLRKAATRFQEMGYCVSHCGLRPLLQEMAAWHGAART
jgi:putative DNA-invertase from lambdoid prophage Rac